MNSNYWLVLGYTVNLPRALNRCWGQVLIVAPAVAQRLLKTHFEAERCFTESWNISFLTLCRDFSPEDEKRGQQGFCRSAASDCGTSKKWRCWWLIIANPVNCRLTIHTYIHTLMAVAAMQGDDQHIRSSLGFSILPKDTLTCRPGESNQQPSSNKMLALPLRNVLYLTFLLT